MSKLWDTLWIDIHAATMEAGETGYGIIENAAIGVKDGRIAWIGERQGLPTPLEQCAETVASGDGSWVLPGLIDCHTHLVFGGNRAQEFEQRLEGVSYEEIMAGGGGIHSTVRETRRSSDKDLLSGAQARADCLAREGVTTIEIKSGYGLNLATELQMLRTARALGENEPALDVVTTFLGAHALPGEYSGNRAGYIDLVVNEMLPAVAEEGLADAVDGFCETIAFDPIEIRRVFSRATSLGLPVKLHADQLSDTGGARLAAEFGALSADHLEYISEDGVAALADSGTVAVLLPGAFYTLRESRVPPLDQFRQNQVPIAIATDANPGSSPILSIQLMLNMACVLFGMTPVEVLGGVTRNAAAALGLLADRGTLEVGKRADFSLWEISHPSELAYMVCGGRSRGVVKDGTRFLPGNPVHTIPESGP